VEIEQHEVPMGSFAVKECTVEEKMRRSKKKKGGSNTTNEDI
jgi:hypothetical protein